MILRLEPNPNLTGLDRVFLNGGLWENSLIHVRLELLDGRGGTTKAQAQLEQAQAQLELAESQRGGHA